MSRRGVGPQRSHLEEAFAFQLHAARLPAPTRELVFAPPRKWAFDHAWPDRLIAVEIDGGGWVQGRHGRARGMRSDCEKANAAALLGWTVFRFTGDMVKDGSALTTIEQALNDP